MSENKSFLGVKAFHEAFGHPVAKKPTAIDPKTAVNRAVWTGEEIVEFLFATAKGDKATFEEYYHSFLEGLEKAYQKILASDRTFETEEDVLVGQVDALTDISYFNYGSFVVAGVDPQPIFDIVQRANMGKLGPDGKPIYRKEDGKIAKPEGWEENYAPEPRIREEIKRQRGDI